MTPYDASLARRTAVLGVVLSVLAFALLVITDDAGQDAGFSRLARLTSLMPVLGGIAAALSMELSSLRGEERSLAGLGCTRIRVARGAVVGGACVGMLGALLLFLSHAKVDALFPRVAAREPWTREGAMLVNVRFDAAATADGQLLPLSTPGSASTRTAPVSSAVANPRGAVLVAIFLGALACPGWAVARAKVVRRAATLGIFAVSAFTAFHLVASGVMPSSVLAIAPLFLLGDACLLHREER